MTTAAPRPAAPRALRDGELGQLSAALDIEKLVGLGWDPERQVFSPDEAHSLLGYFRCPVVGCGNEGASVEHLCGGCATRRNGQRQLDLEEFCTAGPGSGARVAPRVCLVCRLPGKERPSGSSNGLCASCESVRVSRGQSVEAFLTGDDRYASARPRAGYGICVVEACERLAAHASRLCNAHHFAWRRAGRPVLDTFTRSAVNARRDNTGTVAMAGLPPRVVLEMLLGIQAAIADGRKLPPTTLRATVMHLRSRALETMSDLDPGELPSPVCHFVRLAVSEAALTCSSIEVECDKDIWDLRHWGKHGRLSFIGGKALKQNGRTWARPITQRWLKTAAKAWATDALVSRGKVSVQSTLNALGMFSEHLGRREDAGEDPAALSRRDVEAFLARLGRLQQAGSLTAYVRCHVVDHVARFLRDCRALGLTGPGGPMQGLADDVALRRNDRPAPPRKEDGEVGRAVPEAVLTQLLSEESLSQLEELAGPMARAAVELQAGVGRRTSELCGLRLSCLDYDEHVGQDGTRAASPVLVHDMPKVGRVGYRLPIHEREAKIIATQQVRVRAAFPATAPERLALFPRLLKNPEGTQSVAANWLERVMRTWVDALARLDGPETDARGRAVPFDRSRVFPYAFRHSFAQRHADAGTPIDVLKELLGHDTIRVTGSYYRVTTRRKRAAQDALGALQIDATGRHVRRDVTALEDAEALREQIGQVAVPFGICTEPRNVAADGRSCPFRHRCTGCTYFRTDPSYQPELRSYLTKLIEDHERLAAAVPQLAEWARSDAAPSEEEIEAVRNLIRSNDEVLESLDNSEQERLQSAISTLRKARASLTTTFPVELRGLVRPTRPTLFPGIERSIEEEASGG